MPHPRAMQPLDQLQPRAARGVDDRWLRRELAAHLLSQQRAAVVGHLITIAALGLLLWPVAPSVPLGLWIACILGASLVRRARWRAARGHPAPETLVPGVRVAIAVVSLAWGIGAAVVAPALPPEYLALVLLLLGGLVAAATATLAADSPAFLVLLFAALGPLPFATLLRGQGHFEVGTVLLIVFFGAFMWVLQRRSHASLVQQLRATGVLHASDAESRRARAFLEALFASAPNPIVVVDAAGRITSVNPGFETLFGFSQEEVTGRLLVDVIVPSAGREAAIRLQERARAGETVSAEVERCRKDGRRVIVRISVAKVESGGEVMVIFLYTEVTAMRKAEAELRAARTRLERVVGSSTAVIYVTRVEGETFVPSWVSENLTRITGYEVSEALDPAWWVDRLHPEDRPRVLDDVGRLLILDYVTTEYRFRMKDDAGYRWIHDSARLTRDESGKPLEIFGSWLDITDRKLAEEAMREGRELAERAARTQAAFLANMSHEIRTPMNAVLGLTALVLDTELSSYQRRSLGLVRSAGETLLTLLNDILDISKAEADQWTLESIAFDVRYLVESTASLLAVRIEDRPIELVVDVGPEIPHLVRGDPTRLRQVLTNLVGNAIKFTHSGEVVLSATGAPAPDGSPGIRFAVRDTGIGIAPGETARIFEEFTQADASMTRRYGGTGLGLAIARRLVTLMGGELAVRSEEGRGSEFSFTLRLPVEAARRAAAPSAGFLAGRRMLVVDDNATNRRIVRELLAPEEVAVDEAPTADRGLEAIRRAVGENRPYDLAIIDVQMPDRDGFDLAAAIRSEPDLGGLRLLMLTSAGQQGDTQRCRDVGIEGYLTKPVSRADLLEMTATLLGGSAEERGSEPVTRHSMAESRRHLRILLAEDNAVNQELAATMLRKRGHRVDIVSNGREAVVEVARRSYDVVLMDIQMPEMDGFTATRVIRATPAGADLPIIALTAHALAGERERCLANGMSGYVTKPFSPDELCGAVERIGEPRAPAAEAPSTEAVAIDIAGFRRTMSEAGAEDAVDGILEMYAQQVPLRLAALTEAVGAGDAQAIDRAAHAFKSSSASIGAVGLAGVLQEIELAGRNGDLDRARAAFERVGAQTDAVLEYLRLERERRERTA